MERYILGIDIGTTSVKALLISESGALAAEGKADHDLISAHPGWAEENAEVWWSNAVAAVRQITDAHPDMAENIVSAGVSGMVPALVLNGENFSTAAELLGRDLCHVHFIDIDLPKKWNVPCAGRWNAPDEGLPEGAFRPRLHGRHHAGALGNNLPPLRAAGNGKEPCVSARKQLVKLRKPKNRTCLSNQAGPVLLSEACAFSCQISRRRAR